ncbi:MAG: helix-turn-helix domain-containing protein [Cyanobacteria bacterium P01_C01_bin.120]
MSRDRLSTSFSPSQSATERLQTLMAAADISNFRALAQRAQVTSWAVQQLRRDRITTMRVEVLQRLAAALGISLTELLQTFGAIATVPAATERAVLPTSQAVSQVATLQAEYQRLQTQLEQQAETLVRQFQREALAVLESWLMQWPTAAHAVEKNPDLPASRLLPLVQPMQALLDSWGVEAIAPVGAIIPFDPQAHQSMSGHIEPGAAVKIRYAGFRWQGQLLHRAKVSPADVLP